MPPPPKKNACPPLFATKVYSQQEELHSIQNSRNPSNLWTDGTNLDTNFYPEGAGEVAYMPHT